MPPERMEVDSLWAVETAFVSSTIFTMLLEGDGGEDESSSSSVVTPEPGLFPPEVSPSLLEDELVPSAYWD